MKAHGFLHFDGHFGNVLTDDKHVYFADFGLATSVHFQISPEEEAFYKKHRDYDRSYVAKELVLAIVTAYRERATINLFKPIVRIEQCPFHFLLR